MDHPTSHHRSTRRGDRREAGKIAYWAEPEASFDVEAYPSTGTLQYDMMLSPRRPAGQFQLSSTGENGSQRSICIRKNSILSTELSSKFSFHP